MKKSKQLVGVGIVDIKSGKIIGKLKGTVFSPSRKKILGFSVDCGRWVKNTMVLMARDISNIGRDMITVKDELVLYEYDRYPEFAQAANEKERIMGLKVITITGEELGYIDDIILDEKSLCVEGYVLTDGIIEDILRGKSIIPRTDEIIFGEDAAIVSSSGIILKNDISLRKVLKRGRRFRC